MRTFKSFSTTLVNCKLQCIFESRHSSLHGVDFKDLALTVRHQDCQALRFAAAIHLPTESSVSIFKLVLLLALNKFYNMLHTFRQHWTLYIFSLFSKFRSRRTAVCWDSFGLCQVTHITGYDANV